MAGREFARHAHGRLGFDQHIRAFEGEAHIRVDQRIFGIERRGFAERDEGGGLIAGLACRHAVIEQQIGAFRICVRQRAQNRHGQIGPAARQIGAGFLVSGGRIGGRHATDDTSPAR
jgi:hypothetical protein